MRVGIELIDEKRAAELLESGTLTPGVEGGRDAELAALKDEYVEAHLLLHVTWRTVTQPQPAALSIALPRQEQRAQIRTAPLPDGT
jgi:hypothetical protein